ncbi:MAG: DUF2269 domain-containing protein [Moraxella sp.]|nr:DUF2269 domain-containing protein [Moraxella sp.]
MDSLLLYQTVKTLHILSAVLLLGTGFGTAFYLFFANRSGSVPAISVVSYWVCKADFWFTTPCVFVQFFSGLWLMHALKMPFSATWIWASLGLFFFVGACWLPVVVWQLKMRDLAKKACDNNENLPAQYWQLAKKWEMMGYPAFCATIAIVFLMVFKPM